MRHVFVCTTEYGDHWTKTIARKAAQVAAMSDAEKVLEEHIIGGKPVNGIVVNQKKAPPKRGFPYQG